MQPTRERRERPWLQSHLKTDPLANSSMGCLWHSPINKRVSSEIAHVIVIEELSLARSRGPSGRQLFSLDSVTAAPKIYVGVLFSEILSKLKLWDATTFLRYVFTLSLGVCKICDIGQRITTEISQKMRKISCFFGFKCVLSYLANKNFRDKGDGCYNPSVR